MTKLLFNNPLMLGFDHIEAVIDKLSKCSDNYPPYNIEQTQDNFLVIKLAVAGFYENELSVSQEGNQLIVCGNKLTDKSESSGNVYIHRGLSFRRFSKTFLLAEGIEPVKSFLDHGILTIELKKKNVERELKIISIESK